MKILKYKKKSNGKYSLFLDDGREFVYYEEVILQFNLLLTKTIEEEDLLTIHNANLEYDVYYVEHLTFCMDVKVIIDTVKTVLSHDGVVLNALPDFDDYRKEQSKE